MADIVSTVLTKFTGNNSDLKKKIKETDAVQQKAGKAQVKSLQAQNAGLEKSIATWGKVAAGIGSVMVAVKALQKGFETLQVNERLYAATAGSDMEGLRKATSGLVDDTRIMQFAAKAMNGTFKLSQEQMERTLKGVVALRKTMGHELAPTLDRVEKAITEGNVEALKKLGLVMDGVKANSVEAMEAAVKALGGEYDKLGGNVEVAGDAMGRSGVKLANATDTMSESIGRIAVALTPVVAKLADIVSAIANIGKVSDALIGVDTQGGSQIDQLKRQLASERAKLTDVKGRAGRGTLAGIGLSAFGGGLGAGSSDVGKQQAIVDNLESYLNQVVAQNVVGSGSGKEYLQRLASLFDIRGSLGSGGGGAIGGGSGKGKGKAGSLDSAASDAAFRAMGDAELNSIMAGQGRADDLAQYAGLAGRKDGQFGGLPDMMGDLKAILANAKALESAKQQKTMLAGIFGTPEEITAQATALEMFSGTFNTLATAAGSAFDAMITGSMSAGEAFKKAIAEGLRGMAVEMFVKSIREGAMAVASYAIGDFAGGTAHLKSAGMFAAGAAAAGIGASQLGAGATSAKSSAADAGAGPASAGVPAAGGSQGSGKTTNVYMLGESFEGMSPRERAARFRKKGRKSGFSIDGDVIFDG